MLNLGILPEVTGREGVSHVFAAEVNMQNLAALTVLDKVYLSLLPEENGFVRVWELLIVVGCCENPGFCQKNMWNDVFALQAVGRGGNLL